MTTVFLVWVGEDHLLGIFSSEEKALAFANKHRLRKSTFIEEWDVQ